MPESPLPPVCQAPTCRETATLTFMNVTPLCRRHGAKANRRAATNVLFVGVGFALLGAALLVLGRSTTLHMAIAGAVVISGVIIAAMTFWYRRAAARLEKSED